MTDPAATPATVAEVLAGAAATAGPWTDPATTEMTYAVIGAPFAAAAVHVTPTRFAPAVAVTVAGADGTAQAALPEERPAPPVATGSARGTGGRRESGRSVVRAGRVRPDDRTPGPGPPVGGTAPVAPAAAAAKPGAPSRPAVSTATAGGTTRRRHVPSRLPDGCDEVTRETLATVCHQYGTMSNSRPGLLRGVGERRPGLERCGGSEAEMVPDGTPVPGCCVARNTGHRGWVGRRCRRSRRVGRISLPPKLTTGTLGGRGE